MTRVPTVHPLPLHSPEELLVVLPTSVSGHRGALDKALKLALDAPVTAMHGVGNRSRAFMVCRPEPGAERAYSAERISPFGKKRHYDRHAMGRRQFAAVHKLVFPSWYADIFPFHPCELRWRARETDALARALAVHDRHLQTYADLQRLENEEWLCTLAGWGSPTAVAHTVRVYGPAALDSALMLDLKQQERVKCVALQHMLIASLPRKDPKYQMAHTALQWGTWTRAQVKRL